MVRLNGLPISAFTHSMYHDVTKLSVRPERCIEKQEIALVATKSHDLNRLITNERPLITSHFRELYRILASFLQIKDISLPFYRTRTLFILFLSLPFSYALAINKICLREREQVFVRRWRKEKKRIFEQFNSHLFIGEGHVKITCHYCGEFVLNKVS